MLISLELLNFRSYDSAVFEFLPGVNIIVGPNASGKTNLLQAVYGLCSMQSFGSQKQNLKIGEAGGRVRGFFNEPEQERVLKLSELSKPEISIDGVVFKRLSAERRLPVVVFQPDHIQLLLRAPELRREYLDGILTITQPGYSKVLSSYKKALAQRNQLLKNPSSTAQDAFVWDVQLVEFAGKIVSARQDITHQINQLLPHNYHKIASGKDGVSAKYIVSGLEDKDNANYADFLHSRLKSSWELDRVRGFTSSGPHRDDIEFRIRRQLARDGGSRGEVRSLVLALKLFEIEAVASARDQRPILLLDDVFGELDGARRKALAAALNGNQTFLTTTDADVVVDHFQGTNIIPI